MAEKDRQYREKPDEAKKKAEEFVRHHRNFLILIERLIQAESTAKIASRVCVKYQITFIEDLLRENSIVGRKKTEVCCDM